MRITISKNMNYNKLDLDNLKSYIIQNLNTDLYVHISDEDAPPLSESGYLLKRGQFIKIEKEKYVYVKNVRLENSILLEYSEYSGDLNFIWGQ